MEGSGFHSMIGRGKEQGLSHHSSPLDGFSAPCQTLPGGTHSPGFLAFIPLFRGPDKRAIGREKHLITKPFGDIDVISVFTLQYKTDFNTRVTVTIPLGTMILTRRKNN